MAQKLAELVDRLMDSTVHRAIRERDDALAKLARVEKELEQEKERFRIYCYNTRADVRRSRRDFVEKLCWDLDGSVTWED